MNILLKFLNIAKKSLIIQATFLIDQYDGPCHYTSLGYSIFYTIMNDVVHIVAPMHYFAKW